MSSKTKIVVLRMKEIIYTAIFIGLGILLITLFLFMFRPKKDSAPASSQALSFVPGVYSSTIILGSQNVNVEVAVDAGHINSISLVPLSDSVTTMYPLMQPALNDLKDQILQNQNLENITYSNDSRYTSAVLLDAIRDTLKKAEVKE